MDKRRLISKIVYIIGMIFAVAPPLIAFIEHFPVLKEKNYGATVSWFAVAMIAICCIPFWRKIKEYFKSPDTAVLWLVVFVIFTAVKNLIDGMIVVAFCGLVGNLAAKALFFASAKIDVKGEGEEEVTDNGRQG